MYNPPKQYAWVGFWTRRQFWAVATVLRTVAKLSPFSKIGLITLVLMVVATGMGGPNGRKRRVGIAAFPLLTVWAWENPED
ncbi:MAG: hypothetical protein ABSA59_01640, partial [Terriglobia bacterium]